MISKPLFVVFGVLSSFAVGGVFSTSAIRCELVLRQYSGPEYLATPLRHLVKHTTKRISIQVPKEGKETKELLAEFSLATKGAESFIGVLRLEMVGPTEENLGYVDFSLLRRHLVVIDKSLLASPPKDSIPMPEYEYPKDVEELARSLGVGFDPSVVIGAELTERPEDVLAARLGVDGQGQPVDNISGQPIKGLETRDEVYFTSRLVPGEEHTLEYVYRGEQKSRIPISVNRSPRIEVHSVDSEK